MDSQAANEAQPAMDRAQPIQSPPAEPNVSGSPGVSLLTPENFLTHENIELQTAAVEPQTQSPVASDARLLDAIIGDFRQFYDLETITRLGGGLAVGSIAANSNFDEAAHTHFQASVHDATSDEWNEILHSSKGLGDGFYALPVFATAWGLGAVFPENPLAITTATWGERSLRAFLVGGLPVYVLQLSTGASRPGESPAGSAWNPWQDDNGVSGHSFVSAIPFITAAKMTEDARLKVLFYAASTLGPLSRINDGDHYVSQAFLGWWIAYLAAEAVNESDLDLAGWEAWTAQSDNGPVAGVMKRF